MYPAATGLLHAYVLSSLSQGTRQLPSKRGTFQFVNCRLCDQPRQHLYPGSHTPVAFAPTSAACALESTVAVAAASTAERFCNDGSLELTCSLHAERRLTRCSGTACFAKDGLPAHSCACGALRCRCMQAGLVNSQRRSKCVKL